MKKSWKIALWTCSGLLLTTSSVFPIVGCSFSSKYQPSDDVTSNPSFTFKNQGINYYSGDINWKDTYDWAAGLVNILLNQANVEASNSAKLSTWNKNINQKVFSNDIDNNLIKGKKLTLLYSINTLELYKDELLDFNNNEALFDIIFQVFSQIKESIEKIVDLIKNGINEILVKIFERLKENVDDAKQTLIDKIIETLRKLITINKTKNQSFTNNKNETGESNDENEEEAKDLFFHISPIVEDQVYNSKKLSQDQKDAYKSFNLMNDHMNIETDYLFDRYLFFHEINTLFYKKTYNDKKNEWNFINIKSGDFLKAIDKLFLTSFTDWSGIIKIIIWSIVGSIPISFEAMLLEDLYIRLKRWQNSNDPNWNIDLYKGIYEEIKKRWEVQLLPTLNTWIKNSFSFHNKPIDLTKWINIDFILKYLDDIGVVFEELGISSDELKNILEDIKTEFANMFKIQISLNLGYIYENLCTPVILNIINALSNPKSNIILIFQLIIDELSKVGKDNLQFIEKLTEYIQNLGNKLNDIIVKIQQLLKDFQNWFDKIKDAIKKDQENNNSLGLKDKITDLFKQIIPLLKDFKGNFDQIKEILGDIDELVKQALGGI